MTTENNETENTEMTQKHKARQVKELSHDLSMAVRFLMNPHTDENQEYPQMLMNDSLSMIVVMPDHYQLPSYLDTVTVTCNGDYDTDPSARWQMYDLQIAGVRRGTRMSWNENMLLLPNGDNDNIFENMATKIIDDDLNASEKLMERVKRVPRAFSRPPRPQR